MAALVNHGLNCHQLINGIRSRKFLSYLFDKAGLLSGICMVRNFISQRLVLSKTGEGVGLWSFTLSSSAPCYVFP
jgi:hypothetical protein